MRFKGVSNAKRLEVKLDNINDQKFVNLPRFARQTQIQALKQKVINRWEPSKEFCKPLKKTNRPTLRSYAEVTIKGNIQGGKTKREDIPPTISITPHEGRGYWCNNAWVGKLKKAMAVERMEDRIAWDLGYNIRTKFLGDDMILLTRLSDEKAQELINMEIDNGNSLFYS